MNIFGGGEDAKEAARRRELETAKSTEYGDIFGVEVDEKPDLSEDESKVKTEGGVKKREGEHSGSEDENEDFEENKNCGTNEQGLKREGEPGGGKSQTDKGKKNSGRHETSVKGKPKVDPHMFRAMDVSEPESDDEKNYPAIYDNDLDTLEEKPWREPDADITDWFNYGFDEDSWRDYCAAQVKMRLALSRKKEGKDDRDERVEADRKRKHKETPGANPSSNWKKPIVRGVCFDFQNKGFCSRGTSCRWRHEAEPIKGEGELPPRKIPTGIHHHQKAHSSHQSHTHSSHQSQMHSSHQSHRSHQSHQSYQAHQSHQSHHQKQAPKQQLEVLLPPPSLPTFQPLGNSDVKSFMSGLKPVSSLSSLMPNIINGVRPHGSSKGGRDKKRKRKRSRQERA